jgi:trans-aconitate methyltransferase
MIWEKCEVAQAQRDLVESELLMNPWPMTYRVFVKAVNTIYPNGARNILDAGCGVGHYGVICNKMWKDLKYTGTDISIYMLKHAREMAPWASFKQQQFENNDFDRYDICLASSSMEYTASPWDSLDILLDKAQNYVILHRMHMTNEESHLAPEPTYCGFTAKKMFWNYKEVKETITNWDYEIILEQRWDVMMTLVLR